MQKRDFVNHLSTVLAVAVLAAGCASPQKTLDAARAAENAGSHREASGLFTALALETSYQLALPEASKGKVIKPEAWMGDMNRYIKWLTEDAAPKHNSLRDALDGISRVAGRFNPDNTFHAQPPTPFDSLPAFASHWNRAFNPPPPESADWNGLVKRAADLKFSILRMSAPQNYTYDVNIIRRKNARRVNFTLYAENQTLIPLPPGDYVITVRSSVDYQQGQRWVSEFSTHNLTVPDEPALIPVNMRTHVARRE